MSLTQAAPETKRVDTHGEVMHGLVLKTSLFPHFKALEIQQHCCKALLNNKTKQSSQILDS